MPEGRFVEEQQRFTEVKEAALPPKERLAQTERTWFDKVRKLPGGKAAGALLSLFLLCTEGCGKSPELIALQEQVEDEKAHPEKREMREFRQEIENLIASGYEINCTGMTVSIEGSHMTIDAAKKVETLADNLHDGKDEEPGFTVYEELATPKQVLENERKKEREQDHDDKKNKKITVPAYQLVFSVDGDKLDVVLKNWITGKTVSHDSFSHIDELLKLNYSFDDEGPGEDSTENSKYKAAVAELHGRIRHAWQKTIDALRHDKTQTVDKALLSFAAKAGVEKEFLTEHLIFEDGGNGVKKLMELQKKGYGVDVSIASHQDDRYLDAGKKKSRNFTTVAWEEYDGHSTPVFNDVILSVWLHKSHKTKPSEGPSVLEDKYGNVIVRDVSETDDHEYFFEDITVNIPMPTLAPGEKKEKVPVSIDLSQYGIDVGENVFFHKPQRVLGTVGEGKYLVYSNTAKVEIEKGMYREKLEKAGEGVEIAEKLFGAEKGAFVKSIFVVNENEENGFFRSADKSMIALTDEHLKAYGSSLDNTGSHEAFHLIDYAFDLTKQPEVQQLFKELPTSFFDEINEKNWSVGGFGGHAQDNEKEFFATFMNSLAYDVDHIKTKLMLMGGENKALYKKVALTMQQTIENNPKLKEKNFAHLPILDRLKAIQDM